MQSFFYIVFFFCLFVLLLPLVWFSFSYAHISLRKDVSSYRFRFLLFVSQENEAHRHADAVKSIAMNSIQYQPAHTRPIHYQPPQQQLQMTPAQTAYVYTEIENRPPINSNVPHPPLQTVYPAAIQNNIESRIIHRPAPVKQFTSSPIPSSLPSIVHEPTNTVAAIQNVPPSFINYAQSYSSASPPLPLPLLASASSSSSSTSSTSSLLSSASSTFTNANGKIYSHENSDAREKVVVKVVKAPGWYLNDANERRSYFDAVAHGLLSENGLVYVNNVQKENPSQTIPPIGTSHTRPNASHLSHSYVPTLPPMPQLQLQSIYQTPRVTQPLNFINYCPCGGAQNTAKTTLSHPPQQYQAQTGSFKKRSATEHDPYSGPSSYNVGLQSVGRLAGDNLKYEYNLASLRHQPPPQRPYSLQSQPSQRSNQ